MLAGETDDSSEGMCGLEARAEELHRALVELVADARREALEGADPEPAVAVLVAMVRLSCELRLLAERELGLVLSAYRDDGGRDSRAGLRAGRRIRRLLGGSRTLSHLLRRFSEIDDAAFEALLGEVWSGGWPPAVSATALVRGAVRRGKTPPSDDGGE